MPFDFLATRAVATTRDYRRRPDGSVDCDQYRQGARQARAQALGRALAQTASICSAMLVRLVGAWLVRRERMRARKQLLAMDDRLLRDIGISRCDATQGVKRILWRP